GSTNRKCPYTELKSDSQKNKRIALAAKDLNIQTAELFYNHQFVNSLDTNIVKLELAKLKIADKDIILDYELKNKNKKQYYNSLIQICDKALIFCNRYQKLAAIDSNIVWEYLLEQQRNNINDQMKQHLPIVLFNIN
ncbi:14827_t:CDS:1, partial [Racocetra fulgida]